ncbi:hypothetical protein [Chryseobacterium ginsengisoli]
MRKPVNTVKTPISAKFTYIPKSDEEIKHLEWLSQLLNEKRRGDWQLVASMIKVSAQSAEKAFFRVFQKNHFEASSALAKVINQRKQLLNIKS